MFVIKRVEDGKYVAKSSSFHSYTNDRSQAAEYKTVEEAEKQRCGNESIYQSFHEKLVRCGSE